MRTPKKTLATLLDETMGDGVAARISRAFELMEVAEQEIRTIVLRLLDEGADVAARRAWNAFGALYPPPALQGKPEGLYRLHVRDLLERASAGVPLAEGSKAEVLLAISAATLASRLDADVEQLGLALAAEAFPEQAGVLLEGSRESYAGARAEVLRELRRKCRVDDRELPKPLREIPAAWLERNGRAA